jgi:serine/threonine protein kinase
LPEQAAIKLLILPWQLTPEERDDFRARFRREAETLQQLRHPHILALLASGEDAGFTYMVLPYIAGGTLSDGLAAHPGGLSLDEASRIATQLASALDYAHDKNIIHRDVKSGNVLLDSQGQAYLTDFGIVRLLAETSTKLTSTGQVLGTPMYMSPEQVSSGKVGPATDTYSLGMVLYEMVTGHVAFEATTLIELIRQQVQDPPPPPQRLRPELPAPAEAAIMKALAKRPEYRLATASALARAFAAGLRGEWSEELRPQAEKPKNTTADNAPNFAQTLPAGVSYETSGQYLPGATQLAPSRRNQRSNGVFLGGTVAAVLLVALLVLLAKGGSFFRVAANAPNGNASPSATTFNNKTAPVKPLVPVGRLLYTTNAPGACDNQGGQWSQNSQADQRCENGALVMSDADCNCPLGVAVLTSLPGMSYPASYVAQVNAEPMGQTTTAKFGFKFQQQSAADANNGRGGYSFLVDPNGQWQFNRYSANGNRQILVQRHVSSFAVSSKHTLDLIVDGTAFSFYFDGALVFSTSDSTYTTGFLCLAVEPAATVNFTDLAIYATP